MRSYRVGDEPISGYKLLKKLGSGGFGEVWKASAPGGAQLAVKIINLNRKQGYKEFRALNLIKHIHHPNLTPIYAFWLKDEEGCVLDEAQPTRDSLLMPPGQQPVRGTMVVESPGATPAELLIAMGLGSMSLYDRLMQCRSQGMQGIPAGELLEYMEEAAKAIDFLNSPVHDLGSGPIAIQHCDIKPQNILLVGNSAQVCDFGLARGVNDIRTSGAAGSPAYSPPECIGANKPSPQTDQYSLAITYYELRTGELPFEDDSSYMAVASAHMNGQLVLKLLPDDEQKVIKRATSLNPTDRFETTAKMVRAIRRACPESEESVVVPPPTNHLDVGNGYRLVEPIARHHGEEIWAAVAPGGKKVAVLVRNLKDPVTAVDEQALTLVLSMKHNRLSEVTGWWFLDSSGRVIPDNVRATPGSTPANKLVMVGKLAGSNLAQRLQDCREQSGTGIPAAELLRYMEQLAEAVDFLNAPLHSLGAEKVSIQHCNLRPVNMLLDDRGVRLGNFALARVLSRIALKVDRQTFGAEAPYVAPEVLEGRLTDKSDQYVLAVNYAHLRTGKLPFDPAGSTRRIVEQQLSGFDLTGLTFAEAEAVRKATSEEPSARFANSKAFVAALRAALEPGGGAEVTTTSDYGLPEESSFNIPAGAGPQLAIQPALAATMIVETPHGVTDTQPLAKVIEDRLRKDGQDHPPAKVRRSGSRKVAAISLVLASAAAVAGVFALLPSGAKTDPAIDALIAKHRYASAWDLLSGSSPTLNPDDVQRLQSEITQKWRAHLIGSYEQAQQETGEKRKHSLDHVVAQAEEFLEKAAPGDSRVEELLASSLRVDLKDQLAQAHAVLVTAEESLAAGEHVKASEDFTTVLSTEAVAGEPIENSALIGRARARAGLHAWTEMRKDLERVGHSQPIDQDQQTIVGVLKAIASAQGTSPDVTDVLQQLKQLYTDGKLIAVVEKLPEAKLLDESKRSILDRVVNQEPIPDAQRELVAAIQPGLFDIKGLLADSDRLLAAEQFADARKSLAAAQRKGGTANQHQVQQLSWLVDLSDPTSNAANATAAIARAIDEGDVPSRIVEISLALSDRALASPELEPLALRVLNEASTRTDGEPLAEIERRQRDLFKKGLLRQLADADRLNYAKLLTEVSAIDEKAQSDGLLGLVLAECMVEQARSKGEKFDRTTGERASELASRTDLAEGASLLPYAHYVRAIVAAEQPGTAARETSLNELLKLGEDLQTADATLVTQVLTRKNRAAEMLLNAATRLQNAADPNNLDNVMECPFGDPDTRQQAYKLFRAAIELTPANKRSPALLAGTALAAYHEPNSDSAIMRMALQELKPSLLNLPQDQQLAVLVVQAKLRGDAPSDRLASLQATNMLVNHFLAAGSLEDSQALTLDQEFIAPAIEYGETNTPSETAFKQALAQTYALRGKLMRRHSHADWPLAPDEKDVAVFQAFDRAVELDPTQADYLAGRGKARLSRDKADVEGAVKDADAALAINKTMGEALGLRGHCRILLSQRERTYQKRSELLKEAIADLKTAVDNAPEVDVETAIHHINLSVAYVYWGSYVRDPSYELQKTYLQEAEKHALDAIEANRRHPEFAYRTLGNAYEDLAWMIGQVDPSFKSNYDKAIEAFDEAVAADPDDLKSYLFRARCNCKRVVDGRQDKKYLDLAEKDLLHVLEDETQAKTNAEAHYWLAKTYTGQSCYEQADERYAKALEITGNDGDGSALYAFEMAMNAVSNSKLDSAERAKRVRECAAELAKCTPLEGPYAQPEKLAAWFTGMSYELENNPTKALETYMKALPEKTETADGNADERLLMASADLRLKTKDWAGAKKDGLALATVAEHPFTQAYGHGYAGIAAFQQTLVPGGNEAANAEAKEQLRKAIALNPRAPRSLDWRDSLVKILYLGMKPSSANKQQDGKEALKLIADAIEIAPTAERDRLKAAKADIEKRMK